MSYYQASKYYADLFKSIGITLTEQQKELFYNENIESHFWDDFYFMMEHSEIVYDNQLLNNYDTIVFENGQGLLLDQNNMEYFPAFNTVKYWYKESGQNYKRSFMERQH